MHTPSRVVTFIGGGNMARSLIAGLRNAGIPGDAIEVVEPTTDTATALAKDYQVCTAASVEQARLDGATWVLAVKPQVMATVCAALAPRLRPGQRVVSIAAGITAATLHGWLGGAAVLVRAMPNTPALLGAGMTGLYAAAGVSPADRLAVAQILESAGQVRWIDDEALMDVVTAVSGSGPAYVFAFAEALEAAACAQGLPADAARQLVVQTIVGAGRMLADSGQSPAQLRVAVTSPNGTTQAALEALSAGGLAGVVAAAVEAATLRGRALAAGD